MQLLFHFRLSADKIKLDILQIFFTIPLPSHNRMFSFYTDHSFQSSIIKKMIILDLMMADYMIRMLYKNSILLYLFFCISIFTVFSSAGKESDPSSFSS